ncbi:MAG: peptide deformylase [Acetobacter sp.]
MAVRPIVTFPDQRLRTATERVTAFDGTLHALATDLLDTMRAAPGIGITGPHIGVMQQIVVLDLPNSPEPETYINPEIVWRSDETIRHEEGSISMPGISEQIERSAKVHVRYQDLSGTEQMVEADGLRAICLQHEIDQLNGIFWLQRLSALRRTRLIARFEKLKRSGLSS